MKKKHRNLLNYRFQNHFESRILRFLYANDFNIEQTYEVILRKFCEKLFLEYYETF